MQQIVVCFWNVGSHVLLLTGLRRTLRTLASVSIEDVYYTFTIEIARALTACVLGKTSCVHGNDHHYVNWGSGGFG